MVDGKLLTRDILHLREKFVPEYIDGRVVGIPRIIRKCLKTVDVDKGLVVRSVLQLPLQLKVKVMDLVCQVSRGRKHRQKAINPMDVAVFVHEG